MKVTPLFDVVPDGRRRKVAIGTFDGVHLGHREVIRGNDTVLTFDPHPATVVRPDKAPKLLNPYTVKRDLIGGLGVEELVVIPFDKEFSGKEAEEFVREVLIDRLQAEVVSVGDNFHFGKGARGTPDFLRSHDEFETRQVGLIEVGGEPVSSSRIRALVEAGDVAAASDLLGGPFLFEAEVAHGDKRGRELGMPTANLRPDPGLVCPAHGVYAAWAHGHPAAVNVGVRPTFGEDNVLLVEAYLLDFEGDLYGEPLRIAFLERLRGEERFESVEALVEQMGRDVERTREICAETRFDATTP